jgi:peptide methionine sulfoxide reductase MsrA
VLGVKMGWLSAGHLTIDQLGRPEVISMSLRWREMGMGDNAETAVLAGGCAWIMQQLLRQPEGVISTRTGFTGGENDNPTEEDNIGHAEVVEVVFDPVRLSYRGLLEVFFQVHRADLDEGIVGSQNSSEAFFTSPEQRRSSVTLTRRAIGPTKQ